jgi:pimeloyl-ACP methyl ester carboxylesterase
MAITELTLHANGIRFHALADGPERGPLVLLLHGFPELSHSWRAQLPALAAAGYYAVAPDLRGYGKTDKHGPYDLWTLSADIAGLVHALGHRTAIIVGHDWGGGVAWGTAFLQPHVVEKLVVLNCPHPALLGRELLRNPAQLKRSTYMFFFQLPVLPERLLSRNNGAAIAKALKGGSYIRSVWTKDELKPYRDAFSTPEAVGSALGYYRAAFRSSPRLFKESKHRPIGAPTAIIWGTEDRFLGTELIDREKLAPYFAQGNEPHIQLLEGVGHFVQHEAPDRVNEALVSFLGPAQADPVQHQIH